MKARRSGFIGLLEAIGTVCLVSSPFTVAAQDRHFSPVQTPLSSAGHDGALINRLLAAHNRERAALQLPPLRWDPALAVSAASYGPTLAAIGELRHSPRAPRPGQSENLWMGTRSAYTPEQMVGNWIDERRQFRPGTFPSVSSTGNWIDVGHYTTLIWPTTTAMGCAIHSDIKWDFLICRYSPRGNADGKRVG